MPALSNAIWKLGVVGLLAGGTAGSWTTGADAQIISRREAERRVQSAEAFADTAVARFPALAEVRDVVSNDCASKRTGASTSDNFCSCASAVTMQLWLSGIDQKMPSRLQAFVDDPQSVPASTFLTYQGPELYTPLCQRALGDR